MVAGFAYINTGHAQSTGLASGKTPDFDGNGIVVYPDFFLFADEFGQPVDTSNTQFDLNGDGTIGFPDFFIFADYFGKKFELEDVVEGFVLKEITYDSIANLISICVGYVGDDTEQLLNRYRFFNVNIPGTSYSSDGSGFFDSYILGGDCRFSWGSIFMSDELLNEVFSVYPDGIVNINLSHSVGDGSRDHIDGIDEFLFEMSGDVKINQYFDNHEYQIGVVQIVPPGFDLEKQNICLWRDEKWGGEGYVPGGSYEDCVAKWDWGSNAQFITTRSYRLEDILFSDSPYTTLNNVTDEIQKTENNSYSVNTYSLKHIGKFWENLLVNHNIEDTRLKKNPKFKVTIIDPIEKENTLINNDHTTVKQFFREAIQENNLNLDAYDFVVYLQYQPEPIIPRFNRSFAGGRNSYNAFPLYLDRVVFNTGFSTMLHEMGHQIFSGNDLYDGFGLKYPVGVPDPLNFPQNNACIMGKNRGLEKVSDTLIRGDSAIYRDPGNFVLCVDTIVEIMDGIENPNCSVENFYAGNCGECTSLNYLACQTQ
jgi:hypothetical protein